MLTERVKATFKDATRKLAGEKKRALIAQVALNYYDSSARKTERELGWDRVSIQRGLDSLRTGSPYQGNYRARGWKKTEEIPPNLEQDIRELIDGDVQADPKFQTTFRYRQVSSKWLM